MHISVRKDPGALMRHIIHVRDHQIATDLDVAGGGEGSGPDPHDLYDSSLGACKALTVIWYARRKGLPLQDLEVTVTRDASQERQGIYRLSTILRLGGDLTEAQRQELLNVAAKCPVHKLMTAVTTEISTALDDNPPGTEIAP
ncbi:MAG TPA: OsmC family protein [Candidatus Aquabacterium excrementipullorum]|nr:OsmC family protein [Candidatus Aquabacterium excrementipullorum]